MDARLGHFPRLREAAARVAAAERQVASLARAAHRAEKRKRKRALPHASVKSRVAVLLYALNGYDPACAASWLEMRCRRRRAAVPERAELARTVEDWFMQSDAEALGAEVAERGGKQTCVGQARRYFKDWRLALWVQQRNAEKGVAIGTAALVHQRGGLHEELGVGLWACRQGPRPMEAAERQWACRWRRRVGGYLCRACQREHVALETMRKKAGG